MLNAQRQSMMDNTPDLSDEHSEAIMTPDSSHKGSETEYKPEIKDS